MNSRTNHISPLLHACQEKVELCIEQHGLEQTFTLLSDDLSYVLSEYRPDLPLDSLITGHLYDEIKRFLRSYGDSIGYADTVDLASMDLAELCDREHPFYQGMNDLVASAIHLMATSWLSQIETVLIGEIKQKLVKINFGVAEHGA